MKWHYEYQGTIVLNEKHRTGIYLVYKKEVYDDIMRDGAKYGFEYEYNVIAQKYSFISPDGKLVCVPDTVVLDECEWHDREIGANTEIMTTKKEDK